ncbi:MAG: C39 family peptidase [Planctomycetes bacterium]|nr:C39 family peptidase [Planctomycetota bacterium]
MGRNPVLAISGLLGCLAVLLGATESCAQPAVEKDDEQVLPSPFHPQEHDNWCWAASGQMVMEYLGDPSKDYTQCAQVDKKLNKQGACSPPTGDPFQQWRQIYDVTGWPQFDQFGFTAKSTESRPDKFLSWQEIKQQIQSKRPFCFTIEWLQLGGHMVVVRGYRVSGGDREVLIYDPYPPKIGRDDIHIPYEIFCDNPEGLSGYAPYHHWRDYYDITKAP